MSAVSVFIDESGDFGTYSSKTPFYLIALVFHDQAVDITEDIERLDEAVRHYDTPDHAIHTGPLVRQENEYRHIDIKVRQRIFTRLMGFTRRLDLKYALVTAEKKHNDDPIALHNQLSKQLSRFLFSKFEEISQYDNIIVYYDNGQIELTKILVTAFNFAFSAVEFRRILPSDYKLAQVADLICTIELVALKAERKQMSNSELKFFGNARDFRKEFLRPLRLKRIN
jgi:hypothetical protein